MPGRYVGVIALTVTVTPFHSRIWCVCVYSHDVHVHWHVEKERGKNLYRILVEEIVVPAWDLNQKNANARLSLSIFSIPSLSRQHAKNR